MSTPADTANDGMVIGAYRQSITLGDGAVREWTLWLYANKARLCYPRYCKWLYATPCIDFRTVTLDGGIHAKLVEINDTMPPSPERLAAVATVVRNVAAILSLDDCSMHAGACIEDLVEGKMIELDGDILIASGEGTGPGTFERYHGAHTARALKARLTKERAGGDRWAELWIEQPGLEDAGYPGTAVYGKLDPDLAAIAGLRAIPAASIRDNPAAILGQKGGKSKSAAKTAASVANGKLGGAPPKKRP